ncbi:MAG: GNAT family N-acetyltransferase [Holophagaceae bacterium]|nr:GNAT family N-acetyltransferase [Holophagaceae bacterium]
MDYALRPARLDDLETILGWVWTPELLKRWGGPALTFPPRAEATWSEMEATPENAFALINPAGQLVGFGQALPRGASAHLARIIVAPGLRGQGVGRILCRRLILTALDLHRPREITLQVYPDNTAALSLYRSLGFVPIPDDSSGDSLKLGLRPGPS